MSGKSLCSLVKVHRSTRREQAADVFGAMSGQTIDQFCGMVEDLC